MYFKHECCIYIMFNTHHFHIARMDRFTLICYVSLADHATGWACECGCSGCMLAHHWQWHGIQRSRGDGPKPADTGCQQDPTSLCVYISMLNNNNYFMLCIIVHQMINFICYHFCLVLMIALACTCDVSDLDQEIRRTHGGPVSATSNFPGLNRVICKKHRLRWLRFNLHGELGK